MPEQDPNPPSPNPISIPDEALPSETPEEDTPMLDVHPAHHAANTWRDFFVHIATIVLGLLIAIGLEQAVELMHHHREVAETREALRVERDENRKAYADGIAEFSRQTAALENNLIVLRYLQQHPGTPQEKLPGILVWHAIRTNLSDSAWKTAQQSNVTALMPQEEVRRNAYLYERIDAVGHSFDEVWPAIVQARLYSLTDPDPSHLSPAEVTTEIELTRNVLVKHFTQAAAFVQLGRADSGFTPALDRDELNKMMRISESEENAALAAAITLTNTRLPARDQIPIPAPSPGPR